MSRQREERNFSMFLPPLDRILGREAQKMHFLRFWGSIHVFFHCKMAKKSILRPGTLFFRLLEDWSPFMWSGLPPGLPLDPSGCYWGPFMWSGFRRGLPLDPTEGHWGSHVSIDLPWLRAQIGANWTPIGGPIEPFGTPIGGPIGIMRTLKGVKNGLLAG